MRSAPDKSFIKYVQEATSWNTLCKDFGYATSQIKQNIEIIKTDLENDLLYLRGSIPGSKNTTVMLRESVKDVRRKTIDEKYKDKLKKAQAAKGKK